MKDKIVFITGATSGIGKETAIGLAKLGAKIVFTTRNLQKGKLIQDEIIQTSKNKNVKFIFCDLASFESIRLCCNEFIGTYNHLNILINNAGIWNFKRRLSNDGIELTFAVNFLAPFLMTNLFLNLLKKSRPARIINLTSGFHGGTINFKDIEFQNSFSGRKVYAQSKLSVILFTKLLAKKLMGTGITVNCVNPGMARTNLGRNANFIARTFFKILGKDPKKAADTSIYLASSSDIENVTGGYFENRRIRNVSGESDNLTIAEKLWNLSIEYVRLNN